MNEEKFESDDIYMDLTLIENETEISFTWN